MLITHFIKSSFEIKPLSIMKYPIRDWNQISHYHTTSTTLILCPPHVVWGCIALTVWALLSLLRSSVSVKRPCCFRIVHHNYSSSPPPLFFFGLGRFSEMVLWVFLRMKWSECYNINICIEMLDFLTLWVALDIIVVHVLNFVNI